jgi:hypothetical protein
MAVQWMRLGAGEVLVASGAGAWIHQPKPGAVGLTGPMPDSLPATHETTRHLLDGAIAAAERAVPRRQPPPMTTRRWAWHLAGHWHCAHHSVALLPEVIARFTAAGRPDLAEFAREKLAEEQGHDQFSLADLRALGFDAEALVREVAPEPVVAAGLDYARGCVRGEDPIEFLGYAYALERRVLRLSDEWFGALDAVLGPGVDAASGVRAHATVLDHEHVEQAVSFFAGLPAGDRTTIALGCYRITQLCCGPLAGRQPSEAELDRLLGCYEVCASQVDGPSGNPYRGERR